MSDWETGRLEAFNNGVLAIAVTLLVLDSWLPDELEPGHLGAALRDLGGSYAAYALSFLVIGIMWTNHPARGRCWSPDPQLRRWTLPTEACCCGVSWTRSMLTCAGREATHTIASATSSATRGVTPA